LEYGSHAASAQPRLRTPIYIVNKEVTIMYIADMENLIIHDMSFVRYECKTRKIPKEKIQKIYSLQTVKRMVDTGHVPQYNGCPHCMSEYHNFDFTKLFR